MTGMLIVRTARHSFQFNGRIENKLCKNGMYRIAKCSVIDRIIAYTSIMLFHSGKFSRDSLEERAFIALNISITTRMERETVEADFDISLENILHPISGNSAEHLWK